MVERALGEVPNVARTYWDWRKGIAYVRFASGQRAAEADLRRAVDERTAFSAGEVIYLKAEADLPDALR